MAAPRRSSLASLLLLTSGLTAAEPIPASLVVHGSESRIDLKDGSGIYTNGFVAHYGDDLVLLGDALRWDFQRKDQQDIWIEGRVVLVRPGVRIHADKLGMHLNQQSGEAWNVQAWIDAPTGRIPVHAEHVRIDRQSMVFNGVSSDRRHGGILAIGARRLTVRLLDQGQIDATRHDASRFVRDISLVGPYFTLYDLPVFWLPYLYRDLSFDYPWTRLRFGNSSRLGRYIRFEIGTGLPEVKGWKTRIGAEVDRFTEAGTGFGAAFDWKHDSWGKGLAKWYAIEPEQVIDKDGQSLGDHNHHVIDGEHRVAIPGGAVSARWVELPQPDGPGISGERFRADYLREDLETRPFARRGVTTAWGLSLGTLVADVERAPLGDSLTTDREFGLQARLADLHLLGPLHVVGDAWFERLRNDAADSTVTRINAEAALRALEWFGGLGADAGVGARGLLYADGTLNGIEQAGDPWRAAPFADAGVRARFAHRYASGVFNVITPRLGIEWIGEGRHSSLPGYRFLDDRDDLTEDRRYLVTSLDTSVMRGRELFHADLLVRWALRDEDRVATDDAGLPHTGRGNLAQIAAVATGRPTTAITLEADLLYDARLEEWERFDAGMRWDALPRASLLYNGSYNPLPGIVDHWEHRPGLELRGNRYTMKSHISTRPGGADVDGVGLELVRRAVDARVSLTYEFLRDQDGDVYDRRWGASVTFP